MNLNSNDKSLLQLSDDQIFKVQQPQDYCTCIYGRSPPLLANQQSIENDVQNNFNRRPIDRRCKSEDRDHQLEQQHQETYFQSPRDFQQENKVEEYQDKLELKQDEVREEKQKNLFDAAHDQENLIQYQPDNVLDYKKTTQGGLKHIQLLCYDKDKPQKKFRFPQLLMNVGRLLHREHYLQFKHYIKEEQLMPRREVDIITCIIKYFQKYGIIVKNPNSQDFFEMKQLFFSLNQKRRNACFKKVGKCVKNGRNWFLKIGSNATGIKFFSNRFAYQLFWKYCKTICQRFINSEDCINKLSLQKCLHRFQRKLNEERNKRKNLRKITSKK